MKIQSNISTVEFFCTTGNQSKLSCDHVSTVLKQALSLVWCGGRIFITVFVWLNSVCGQAELPSAENRKQKSGQRLTEKTLRVIFSLSQEVRLSVVHSWTLTLTGACDGAREGRFQSWSRVSSATSGLLSRTCSDVSSEGLFLLLMGGWRLRHSVWCVSKGGRRYVQI